MQGAGTLPSLSRLSRSEAGHIDRLQSGVGQLRSGYNNPPPQQSPRLVWKVICFQNFQDGRVEWRVVAVVAGRGGKFNLIFYLGLKFGELRSS